MEENLYEILDLSKDCSEDEIKRKYKKLAFVHHPDRGGNPEQFKKITEAYNILSDKEKRNNYDNSNNKPDILKNMFGGMGGFDMGGMFMGEPPGMPPGMFDIFGMNNKNTHNKSKIVNVDITLDDIYLGCKKKINVDISSKCKKCSGNGYFDDGKELCSKCNGNKVLIVTREIGPRVLQQRQINCDNCNAKGFIIKEELKCKKCKGEGVRIKKNEYDLNIKKGSYHNKEIVLKNKGDYIKELDLKGDLILKLNLLEDKNFMCKDNNLYKEIDISLGEALYGGYYKLQYLNNENLYIDIDKTIKPDILMKINGKGLPKQMDSLLYGDLIIKFNIIFPDNIKNKNKLKEIFEIKDLEIEDDSEINNIDYYEKENLDNEEDEMMPQNIQCAQQ